MKVKLASLLLSNKSLTTNGVSDQGEANKLKEIQGEVKELKSPTGLGIPKRELKVMKAKYSDYFELASECFLTKPLPSHATEWSDVKLQGFIEENVSEAYQDWYWSYIYEHIEDTASVFWYELKKIEK